MIGAAARSLPLLAIAAACAPLPHGARDVAGTPVDLRSAPAGRVRVLVFTSHECPIANAYAPTLRSLAARFQSEPVDWFLVHVDPDLAPSAAAAHASAYEIPFRICVEPDQASARALGIERTPEAAVLTAAGPAYVGRIDDQWLALGSRQPTASAHDLADAVADALAGRSPAVARRPAVGCLLPEPARRP